MLEHMPSPPDRPTTKTTVPGTETPPVGAEAQAGAQEAQLPLGADMARIIQEQIDIIVQRQVYHTQMLLGVSAIGTDPVNARNAALIIADALRNAKSDAVEHALVNLGNAQIAQINDKSLPFKFNQQVAGILEGILIDIMAHAYNDDPDRKREARAMLERLFEPANEKMQLQPKATLFFLAPAPDPNARR